MSSPPLSRFVSKRQSIGAPSATRSAALGQRSTGSPGVLVERGTATPRTNGSPVATLLAGGRRAQQIDQDAGYRSGARASAHWQRQAGSVVAAAGWAPGYRWAVIPDHDVRLTWPEADALRGLLGRPVTLLVPAGRTRTGSALHVVLTGGDRPLHVVSTYVPTPKSHAPWLDVERPRIQSEWPENLTDEQPTDPVAIGVVREVAVLTEAHLDDPLERDIVNVSPLARRWRSIRRRLATEEQRIIDDLVEDAETTRAEHRVLTVVDEGFELVGDRVLHVVAVGSSVDWSLDDDADGYERHLLAGQP